MMDEPATGRKRTQELNGIGPLPDMARVCPWKLKINVKISLEKENRRSELLTSLVVLC